MKVLLKEYLYPFFRNFPWYLLLWPVFYAFNVNAYYHGVIEQGTMWFQILKWELLLISFFFFIRVFLSNNIHSAIVTVWFGFLFFYAYSWRNFFLKFSITLPLSNFSYMIAFWCLIGLVLIIFFIRTKSKPVRFSRFLMYLFVTITFYEGINFIIKVSTKGMANYAEQYKPKVSINPDTTIDIAQQPDIYHLIFDSYTNTSCLKRQFNYDNSVLDRALLAENFYVAKESKSNYFDSPVSLASTFNMGYIPKADITTDAKELTYFCGLRNLDNNNLWQFLEEKNYSIYNVSLFNIKNYSSVLRTRYLGSSDEDLLQQKTLQNISLPPLRYFFSKNNPQEQPDFREAKKENMLMDTFLIETELKKVLNAPPTNPIFFYSHCAIPHPPYLFDSTGKLHSTISLNGYNQEGYLEEVIYMRKIILRYVQLIKQKAKRPFLIVIQGDHGYRYFKYAVNVKECFNIINAWYFSDQNYTTLYDAISSVNTYRVILNKYFNTNMPILKDTSYFPKAYKLPY